MTAKKAAKPKPKPQAFLNRHSFIAELIRRCKLLAQNRTNVEFKSVRVAQTPHTDVSGLLFFEVNGDVWTHSFGEPSGNWDGCHIDGIIELIDELLALHRDHGEPTTRERN